MASVPPYGRHEVSFYAPDLGTGPAAPGRIGAALRVRGHLVAVLGCCTHRIVYPLQSGT